MTLEAILYELEVLIMYGGMALRTASSNNFVDEIRQWDLEDVMNFIGLEDRDVIDYIQCHDLEEDIVCNMETQDIRRILRANWDASDFAEMDWRY